MTTVLLVETEDYAGRDLSIEREVLGPGFTLRRFTYTGDDDALIEACRDADGILTDYTPFTADVLEQLDTCRLISVAATGYTCIDVRAAADAAIRVCVIDEYCTDEVADHTLMLILALARKLIAYDRQVQKRKLWRYDTESGLLRLRGLTLALIGLGRIGRAVAVRAAAFGMRVLACDPRVDAHLANPLNVDPCSLDRALAEADVLSLHCPAGVENRHLLDRDAFDKMLKSPIVINVARGALIDEQALVDALDSGRVCAFGGDVLDSESPRLAESALLGRDNVLLTPHVAFYSDASLDRSRRQSAANLRYFFDGQHDKVAKFIHRE